MVSRLRMVKTRRLMSLVFLLTVYGFGGESAFAQNAASTKSVSTKILTTKDGWPIAITYYKSDAGKETPVVILLHGKGGNRLVWNAFATRLHDANYAVISVDLRKHGQSKGRAGDAKATEKTGSRKRKGDTTTLRPTDYKRMVAYDLEAVKKFILEEHQNQNLNMRKTAIVATEMSAPIAINYAMADWLKKPHLDAPVLNARTPRGQDIRALILLSPEEKLPGMTSGPAVLGLRSPGRGIAFLICYSTSDKLDKGQSKHIYQKLTGVAGNTKRMYLRSYATKLRGTDLLGQGLKIELQMLGFLEKHLKGLPGEWRTRKSRIAARR